VLEKNGNNVIQTRSDPDVESRKLGRQFPNHVNEKISGKDVKFLCRVDVAGISNNVKNAPYLN